MKKLYIIAALLMATTSAQAGGITFQINGERVRVEAPRNCNAHFLRQGHLARLYRHARQRRPQGHGLQRARTTMTSQRPRRPHPLRPSRPRRSPPLRLRRRRTRSNNRRGRLAGTNRSCPARSASAARARRGRAGSGSRGRSRPTRRSASGRRKRTRATFASRNAAPICAVIPSTPAKDPDQHEAAGQQVDRPDL